MATEITMPKLSDTMTEGRLISWKKGVGDQVARGDIIAEVETDKATMELEAFTSGVLLEIRIKPGEMAPVGTVIAVVGAAGEKTGTEPPPAGRGEEPPLPSPAPPASPPVAPEPFQEPPEPAGMAGPSSEPPKQKPDTGKPAPSEPGPGEKASPLVRRLAREKGIDLGQVKGSGPEGRVLREDLEKAGTGEAGTRTLAGLKDSELGTREDQKLVKGAEKSLGSGGGVQPLSRMRGAIARTVSESWRTIPHFTVTVEAEMGEAERVRQELKGSGTAVSLNDFIIKAAATAMVKFSRVNASFGADGITVHPAINVGIAVALDDGLLVPVIRGCQVLPLKEIAAHSRDLIARAKAGKVSEAELAGGTFTVSNLGMFGVDEFTAVILPPRGRSWRSAPSRTGR